MELQLYFDILKRYLLTIIIVMAITLMVVSAWGLITPPVYKAGTIVRVSLDPGISDYLRRVDYNERLLETYEHILSSSTILNKVFERLEPRTSSLSLSEFRNHFEVETIPDTELIRITVENEDPVLARDLANTTAALLIEYAENTFFDTQTPPREIILERMAEVESDLEKDREELDELLGRGATTVEVETVKTRIKNLATSQNFLWEQYESILLSEALRANSITIIQPAYAPTSPINSLGLKDIALSMALGMFGGIALALVLENIDTRIRSPQQVEHLTRLPVIGVVPKGILTVDSNGQIGGKGKEKALVEAYRLSSLNFLNLRNLAGDSGLKTVLVTSAVPGEGKTTVASNLSRVFAEWNQTVFLVEGDLRAPKVDEVFGTKGGYVGLSSLLAELSSLEHVIYPTEQPSLFVIGGGPIPSSPTLLLASPAMDRTLNYLGEQGQLILIDMPPVLGVADVSILAAKVDGIILVVQQHLTNRDQINEALKQLRLMNANVVGLIFVQRNGKGKNSVY